MSLWFDNKVNVPGPGTHALVIGTSNYDYLPDMGKPPIRERTFGLEQTDIAATGAWRFAKWLRSEEYTVNARAPLATIRLLLSPSPREHMEFPDMASLSANCLTTRYDDVRRALLEWKKDCASDRENIAVFYVAGHGVAKSKLENYILLQDFAKDNLVMTYSIDPRGVRDGMTGATMAQTQFYFIDACRDQLEEFHQIRHMGEPLALDDAFEGPDERIYSMYFSTSPSRKSYGVPGEGTFYSRALMDCLSGGARLGLNAPDDRGSHEEQTYWHISNISLATALKRRLDEIVKESNVKELAAGHIRVPRKQTVLPEGIFNTSLLTLWKQPPKLYITVHVEPEEAAKTAVARLQDATNVVIYDRRSCVPRPVRADGLAASVYILEVVDALGKRKGPIILKPRLPGIEQTVQL